jgi:1-acyl-sn-glycerol-3-phosphate acyltransferase
MHQESKIEFLSLIFLAHKQHHSIYNSKTLLREIKPTNPLKYANIVLCAENSALLLLPLVLIALPFYPKFSIFLFLFGCLHLFLYNKLHASFHLKHEIKWLPKAIYNILLKSHVYHHIDEKTNFCVSMLGFDLLTGTYNRSSGEEWEKVKNEIKVNSDKDKEALTAADNCIIPAFFKRLKLLSTCGYIPKDPTWDEYKIGKLISKFMVWLLVGKVEVNGLWPKKCPQLIVSNHTSAKDVFIFPLLINLPIRIMAHSQVIGFMGGIFAPFLTKYLGMVPISTAKGIDSAVKLLEDRETVFICPSGLVESCGGEYEYKTGAIRIAQAAGINIVPIYIRYGNYPGQWIKRLPLIAQFMICMLPYYRIGAKVFIGKPLTNLPLDVKLATRQLREEVLKLNIDG